MKLLRHPWSMKLFLIRKAHSLQYVHLLEKKVILLCIKFMVFLNISIIINTQSVDRMQDPKLTHLCILISTKCNDMCIQNGNYMLIIIKLY